jgi:DNA-binding NarL/FixJ family response regulator
MTIPLNFTYDGIHLLPEEYKKNRSTLLLVDDNKDMLYYLQIKLAGDYNVFYAFSGQGALDKLKKIQRPHIIISDIMMDDMDGFAFYDTLIKNKELNSIPFIFLTALTSTHEKIKALQNGAIDYIYKPFHIDELKGKISSLIKIQEALAKRNIIKLGNRLYDHLANIYNAGSGYNDTINTIVTNKKKLLYEKFTISRRQIEILALLKIGLEQKEISTKLGISMNTTKTHLKRMYAKCKVNNKTEILNIFYNKHD